MNSVNNKTGERWKNFMQSRKEILNSLTTELVSLQVYPSSYFENFDPNNEFEKWATVEVRDFERIPSGMKSFILKEGSN